MLVYSSGHTWNLLLGMPVCNHHEIYLWPCAFLGGIAMHVPQAAAPGHQCHSAAA
jgi:hypothetical protein